MMQNENYAWLTSRSLVPTLGHPLLYCEWETRLYPVETAAHLLWSSWVYIVVCLCTTARISVICGFAENLSNGHTMEGLC
jgi:hypothetical protein